MKRTLALALALAGLYEARAADFVFETSAARLVIRSDAVASSLVEKQNGKERLAAGGMPFAAVKKSGQLVQASAAEQHGNILHVTFGASGIDADFQITIQADCIVVELAAFHGDGIEEIRLMQLNVPLANGGNILNVRWDAEFAVCLMALSDHVESRQSGPVMLASAYPAFAMQTARVAIVAVPTAGFLDTVEKAEQNFRLPSPMIGGKWAKRSDDVRTSYLFADLTEANADDIIRYAKLGGFHYILISSGTWTTSAGSYPINARNFPRGEESLKAVIDKCHAAGLKVGMHMLTSLIGRNDTLLRAKPDPRLLKDAEATLAATVSDNATELGAASSTAGFPAGAGYHGPMNDIQIDDEIIEYSKIDGSRFLQCTRGVGGTKAASHQAGAKIYHLAEGSGSYLADLKTSLKDVISERVAGLINRCGFDMIYCDAGELNSADGPPWYWVGQQQVQIWQQAKRGLLVQGSGTTHWSWHIFSRGTCDDYSAVAVKEYLDYHKIADSWRNYSNNFLPAELGWWGFLASAPDHAATVPDEVEYYAVRMLALDAPVSLETSLSALKANGRTEEMLQLLATYEQLRLGGAVPKDVRQRLARGEWHMTKPGEFHPIRYDAQRVAVPGQIAVKNDFAEQPLKFRLQVAPALAPAGDPSNILLFRENSPAEMQPPDAKAPMPGALVKRVPLGKPAQALDLTSHRALGVRIDVEGPAPGSGERPVLNLQLEAGGNTYRDYYIDTNFSGAHTVILAEPGTRRMLPEFRPAFANYAFKSAMYNFDYSKVSALNLRWMRYPQGTGVRCTISSVEALQERDGALSNVEVSAGSSRLTIPGQMRTGDYAEYWGDQPLRIFDRNGVLLRTAPMEHGPILEPGANQVAVKAAGSGAVTLTSILVGN